MFVLHWLLNLVLVAATLGLLYLAVVTPEHRIGLVLTGLGFAGAAFLAIRHDLRRR